MSTGHWRTDEGELDLRRLAGTERRQGDALLGGELRPADKSKCAAHWPRLVTRIGDDAVVKEGRIHRYPIDKVVITGRESHGGQLDEGKGRESIVAAVVIKVRTNCRFEIPVVHVEPKLHIGGCTLLPEQYLELLNEHLSIVGVHAAELLQQVGGDVITTSATAAATTTCSAIVSTGAASTAATATAGVLKITKVDVHCCVDCSQGKSEPGFSTCEDDLAELTTRQIMLLLLALLL